jgi:uncharacterized protein (TIGR02611 family)
MLKWLKKQWNDLKNDPPGCRFLELHRRRQKARCSVARRRIQIGFGVLVLIVGLAMMPLPGPGFPIVLVGAALLARESSRAARALDWLELKLRGYWAWGLGLWKKTSPLTKASLVLMLAANIAAALSLVFCLTSLPEYVSEWLR